MKLSIVTTLYHSESYIQEFHQRMSAAAAEMVGDDYEIVYVNDGSPDNSLDQAVALSGEDKHVVVIDLSRNFGHHKAIMAGLEYSMGDKVFLIDSDLEEDPAWLMEFSRLMSEDNADVVYGRQEKRKGGWFERWSGEVYYTIFNWLADLDHPRNIVTARIMTRRYINALLEHREREMVISCLWIIAGFKQSSMIVNKIANSKTTYSLSKKFKHATNAITSFSEFPLKLIFYFGIIIFLIALVYAGFLVFNRVFMEHPAEGWTSVMASIWLLGGMVISFIGVIGIYLSKIFIEAKQRPYFIVRDIYGRN